jgi:hypothetical protein
MPFQNDQKYAAEIGKAWGEYLTTYTSITGQVRGYLFRKGNQVEAHVVLPPLIFSSTVTDPYVTDLWDYARQNNFADRFQIIRS